MSVQAYPDNDERRAYMRAYMAKRRADPVKGAAVRKAAREYEKRKYDAYKALREPLGCNHIMFKP